MTSPFFCSECHEELEDDGTGKLVCTTVYCSRHDQDTQMQYEAEINENLMAQYDREPTSEEIRTEFNRLYGTKSAYERTIRQELMAKFISQYSNPSATTFEDSSLVQLKNRMLKDFPDSTTENIALLCSLLIHACAMPNCTYQVTGKRPGKANLAILRTAPSSAGKSDAIEWSLGLLQMAFPDASYPAQSSMQDIITKANRYIKGKKKPDGKDYEIPPRKYYRGIIVYDEYENYMLSRSDTKSLVTPGGFMNSLLDGTIKAYGSKSLGEFDHMPAFVNVIASATPILIQNLTDEIIESGVLGRYILLPDYNDAVPEDNSDTDPNIQNMYDGLQPVIDHLHELEKAQAVHITLEAYELWLKKKNELKRMWLDSIDKTTDRADPLITWKYKQVRTILSNAQIIAGARKNYQVMKIKNVDAITISVELGDMEKSIEIMDKIIFPLAERFFTIWENRRYTSQSLISTRQIMDKILDHIRNIATRFRYDAATQDFIRDDKNGQYVQHRNLVQRSHMKSVDLKQHLVTLYESDEIEIAKVEKPGHKKTIYYGVKQVAPTQQSSFIIP